MLTFQLSNAYELLPRTPEKECETCGGREGGVRRRRGVSGRIIDTEVFHPVFYQSLIDERCLGPKGKFLQSMPPNDRNKNSRENYQRSIIFGNFCFSSLRHSRSNSLLIFPSPPTPRLLQRFWQTYFRPC